MKNIVFAAMVSMLLVSGCTMFGSGETQVKEMPSDVLSIQNITVIPSTSVRTRDEFSVYFDVLNQEETDEVLAGFSLYDTGLCKFLGGEPDCKRGDSLGADASSGSCSGDRYLYDTFSPRESRMVEWNFAAPSSEEIANIKVTCPIRFKFNYYYKAESQIDVLVIDRNYLKDLQKSGETPVFSPTLNVGRGPVKIYFDFGTTLPVRDSSDFSVYVKVEDKGTGYFSLNSLSLIPSGTFKIQFPSDFDMTGATCPYFSCDSSNACTSDDDIPMVNRKSLEILCSGIKTPSEAQVSKIQKTYFISATLEYPYSVAGQVDVQVTPRST